MASGGAGPESDRGGSRSQFDLDLGDHGQGRGEVDRRLEAMTANRVRRCLGEERSRPMMKPLREACGSAPLLSPPNRSGNPVGSTQDANSILCDTLSKPESVKDLGPA